jgi:hypothetical protein
MATATFQVARGVVGLTAVALGFLLPESPARAAADTVVPAASPEAVVAPVPLPEAQPAIPAGTLVAIRIDQSLSSQTSHRGDTFSITLMNDVWAADRIILPAGTKGIGEVIHSAGKGFGGRAGELIVTARYLDFEGRRVPLRGFKLAAAGEDKSMAALVSSLAVPMAGMFVTGSSATIGLGQLAQAKLAEPYQFLPTTGAVQSAAPIARTKEEHK